MASRRVADIAAELADATVLDAATTCGPGEGFDYELRELHAAHQLAATAVAAAFSRYRRAVLDRVEQYGHEVPLGET